MDYNVDIKTVEVFANRTQPLKVQENPSKPCDMSTTEECGLTSFSNAVNSASKAFLELAARRIGIGIEDIRN